MAYADQEMSSSKIVSIALVVIIHVILGYTLVTGLAYKAVTKLASELDVVDIQEEKPEEPPEPPPPPENPIEPPPVVSPPPTVAPVAAPRPQVTTTTTAPPPARPAPAPPPAAAPPPPPPPPPKRAAPEPKGRAGSWVTPNDYPSRSLRQEEEGTTSVRVTVGPDGRVADCQISGSSGHPDLDAATCKNLQRRARFDPALDSNGNPTTGIWSTKVRWEIPK